MKIKTGGLTSFLFGHNIERIVKDAEVDIKKLDIPHESAVVINMNTINGYFKEGAICTPRLEKTASKILKVNQHFSSSYKIFFIDRHERLSPELSDYPIHCTSERERQVIAPLREYATKANTFYKNSTNAFLGRKYAKWLAENKDSINAFIITGGMTDISVLQFALTQKAYFNNINRSNVKIAVIANAVQTYDNEKHMGDLMHTFALYNMYLNGIIIGNI